MVSLLIFSASRNWVFPVRAVSIAPDTTGETNNHQSALETPLLHHHRDLRQLPGFSDKCRPVGGPDIPLGGTPTRRDLRSDRAPYTLK